MSAKTPNVVYLRLKAAVARFSSFTGPRLEDDYIDLTVLTTDPDLE